MTGVPAPIRGGLLAIAGAFLCIGALGAQAPVLDGRVVDLEGEPVARQPVGLHKIAGQAGTQVARGTTDGDGRFELMVPADAEEGALFFAVTRYDEKLYIGRAFQRSGDTSDYMIRVGGEGALSALTGGRGSGAGDATGGAAAGGPAQRPATAPSAADGNAQGIWMTGGAILTAMLLIGLAWRVQRRPPLQRRLLLELAELEERYAAERDAPDRQAFERRRRRLRRRLREAGAG